MHGFHQLREMGIHDGGMAETFLDLIEPAECGEVLGRGAKDGFELLARAGVIGCLDQRATERDTRRQVGGMTLETGAAGLHGFSVIADAAELLRQGGEGDGRRVRLDPAPQLLYAGIFRHPLITIPSQGATVIDWVVVFTRPASSVTVRMMV